MGVNYYRRPDLCTASRPNVKTTTTTWIPRPPVRTANPDCSRTPSGGAKRLRSGGKGTLNCGRSSPVHQHASRGRHGGRPRERPLRCVAGEPGGRPPVRDVKPRFKRVSIGRGRSTGWVSLRPSGCPPRGTPPSFGKTNIMFTSILPQVLAHTHTHAPPKNTPSGVICTRLSLVAATAGGSCHPLPSFP